MLFRSEKGKCVLPLMPISGKCTTVTSPPLRLTASAQARAPVIGAREFTALFGYNVAVIHDDGNLSECHELVEGNGNAFQRINAARQSRGHVSFGEGEVAALCLNHQRRGPFLSRSYRIPGHGGSGRKQSRQQNPFHGHRSLPFGI